MTTIAATGFCTWTGLPDLLPTIRWHLSRRCGNDAEVDDVVQETLLRAARYRGTLDDPGRLRPWVLRIATNVLHDRARREARLPRTEVDDEALDGVEGREAIPGELADDLRLALEGDLFSREFVLHHLRAAFEDLRELDRNVLSRRYAGRDGASCVCEAISSTGKVRVYRARRRLLARFHARLVREADLEFETSYCTSDEPSRPARCEPGPLPETCGAACAAERAS